MAQQLARHSTIHLTMANYTHLDRADLAGALESLPTLNPVVSVPSPTPALDQSVAPVNQAPTTPNGSPKIGTKIGTSADGNRGQKVSSSVKMTERPDRGQETPNPLQNKGFSNVCHHLSERRARESNPQRLAPHLISSQAANHSRTLRKCLRNTILRHLLMAVKGLFTLCATGAQGWVQ